MPIYFLKSSFLTLTTHNNAKSHCGKKHLLHLTQLPKRLNSSSKNVGFTEKGLRPLDGFSKTHYDQRVADKEYRNTSEKGGAMNEDVGLILQLLQLWVAVEVLLLMQQHSNH